MLTFGASFLCVNSPDRHTRTLIIFFMNCPQIGQSLGTESMFPHVWCMLKRVVLFLNYHLLACAISMSKYGYLHTQMEMHENNMCLVLVGLARV